MKNLKTAGNRQTALVTGTSSGFGLLISIELAKRGFNVVAGMRRPQASEPLMKAAELAGVAGAISVVEMDITNESQVLAAVEQARTQFGTIDVLVNNAGVVWGGFTEEVPLTLWREQMETNFIGNVSVTQAVLPWMRKQGNGLIIQMSSISGVVGFPGFGPYAASKFALEGFSECLALEVKPYGIDVVLVEPGSYGTDIWEKGFATMQAPSDSPYRSMLESVLAYARSSASGSGNPQEVADLIGDIACSRRRRFRYMLPRSTVWTARGRKWLPDSWFQRILMSTLKRNK
ncbi:SDR family oxidoreductase [Paenibacillus wynnii]|uniref:SDR family oxidoreductase n=1 Tax=Paenibacillus wynnii TaxID=268407 RepID=UPI00278F4BEC|nr:SDR family oxidoreductase [Paenibacillus wynnii]MDQ0196740.1 NAD(P)-dependent dehydrogenase (short-subunit alcohol dehydrogenase family) [Paenibacillus wynnii]